MIDESVHTLAYGDEPDTKQGPSEQIDINEGDQKMQELS